MDFHKYIKEEFGFHPNSKKVIPLHPKESEYYNTLSQKFYEENFLLIILSSMMGSFLLLVSLFVVPKFDFSNTIHRVSVLFLALSNISFFVSVIVGVIAHSLFTYYKMISFGNTVDKERIISALNKAYLYKQCNKITMLSAIIFVVSVIFIQLFASIQLAASFLICAFTFLVGVKSYLQKVKISAQEKSISKLKPIIDNDHPSIFSDIANSAAHTPQEENNTSSYLVPLLQNKSVEVRLYALKSLSKYISPGSLPHIAAMLGDENEEVRGQAALTLGKIGERGSKEALKSLLYDTSSIVRRCAIESLGRLRVGSATNILVTLLDDENAEVRGAAAEAIAYIGKTKTIPILLEKMHDVDWFARYKIVSSLGKFASVLQEEQVKEIMELLQDENKDVVAATENTLKKIITHVSPDQEIYKILKATLEKTIEKIPKEFEEMSLQEKEEREEIADGEVEIDDIEDW